MPLSHAAARSTPSKSGYFHWQSRRAPDESRSLLMHVVLAAEACRSLLFSLFFTRKPLWHTYTAAVPFHHPTGEGTSNFGVQKYHRSPIVQTYLLRAAPLARRRWPPSLGPPTEPMPGHLSPACGLTTLNAPHLRVGQSRCSSSFRELGISIVHLGATVHARPIACMAPFSGWQAASWLG